MYSARRVDQCAVSGWTLTALSESHRDNVAVRNHGYILTSLVRAVVGVFTGLGVGNEQLKWIPPF